MTAAAVEAAHGEAWDRDDRTQAGMVAAIQGALMSQLVEDYLYGGPEGQEGRTK